MALIIRIEGQDTAPRTLGGALISIGRTQGNDLVVPDPRVSGRHGRLVRTGECYAYEDLGSRNGSMVARGADRLPAPAGEPITIQTGDQLLLGDRESPVVVHITATPDAAEGDAGGTVVARRALADGASALQSAQDVETLRALFTLLADVSGLDEPGQVIEHICEGALAQFAHATSVTVELKDGEGGWATACTRSRGPATPRAPSRTLGDRALADREVVTYVPGVDPASGSVMGLAGAAFVPLIVGDHPIGLLHIESRQGTFEGDDLAWLGVVGTHLAAAITGAQRVRDLKQENRALKEAATTSRPIVGESASLKRALNQLTRVARTDTTVLITGETGTGKELAARHVHAHSPRGSQPFAAINCGALPENLLESELFGHVKGAFTGADRDRKGLFESAAEGTVFLDEVGEISPQVQVRLLRVLQEREVQPVGARQPIPINVRIVAATNRDLKAEVKAGRFREDLFYRLAIFPVGLPALREREGDVVLLAERFRELACGRHGTWLAGFSPEALAALVAYPWPGNVRQLEHEIERAVILAGGNRFIGLVDLSPEVAGDQAGETDSSPDGGLQTIMESFEERVIRQRLVEHSGNRTRTAHSLNISRQALQAKLARWRKRDEGA